jgi:hypothetical protein
MSSSEISPGTLQPGSPRTAPRPYTPGAEVMVLDEPDGEEPTLLQELQAGLGEEQRLLDDLAGILGALRAAGRVAPDDLDREAMWQEVQRRMEASSGAAGPEDPGSSKGAGPGDTSRA